MKKIDANPKVCDFSGFTFTGQDGKTYGYDEKGAPCTNTNKPIDTKLTNIGNTGNPFTNWGPSGNFGNSTNTGNISTFNLPSMNIPTNIPLSNDSMSGIKQIGDLHNHAHNLSEFINQYENEPWEKVVKKERPFGIKALTVKKESHVKPHALQVEQAKIELKAVQEQIAKLSIGVSTSQKTSLDYSNRGFNAEDVKNVKAQEGCYELVSFKNNNIGCDGLKHLIYSEEGQTALTKGSSDLKEIYQGMLAKQGVMIAKLDLSNCNIGGLSSDKLGQAIYGSSLNSLQHLNLSNNNITDAGIYAFGNAWFCETSPSLRTLNLSNNKLTDNGAQSLSWSLRKGTLYYLQYLDMSENDIGDEGAKSFAEALKTGMPKFLKNLSLFGNKLTAIGETAIVKALETPTAENIIVLTQQAEKHYNLSLLANKEDKVKAMYAMLESAEKRGIKTDKIVVDNSIKTWLKSTVGFLYKGVSGFTKCQWIEDPVGDYAQDQLIAKIPGKLKHVVKAHVSTTGTVSCIFVGLDNAYTSPEGVQMIKNDLDVLGADNGFDTE